MLWLMELNKALAYHGPAQMSSPSFRCLDQFQVWNFGEPSVVRGQWAVQCQCGGYDPCVGGGQWPADAELVGSWLRTYHHQRLGWIHDPITLQIPLESGQPAWTPSLVIRTVDELFKNWKEIDGAYSDRAVS